MTRDEAFKILKAEGVHTCITPEGIGTTCEACERSNALDGSCLCAEQTPEQRRHRDASSFFFFPGTCPHCGATSDMMYTREGMLRRHEGCAMGWSVYPHIVIVAMKNVFDAYVRRGFMDTRTVNELVDDLRKFPPAQANDLLEEFQAWSAVYAPFVEAEIRKEHTCKLADKYTFRGVDRGLSPYGGKASCWVCMDERVSSGKSK